MLINGQRYNNTVDGSITLGTALKKDRGRFYVLTKVCILDMIFAGDKLCQDKHAKKTKAEYIRRHRTVPCLCATVQDITRLVKGSTSTWEIRQSYYDRFIGIF